MKKIQARQKYFQDQKAGKAHKPLVTGNYIKYKNNPGDWKKGVFTARCGGPTGHEYQITNEAQNTLNRNRTHLIKTPQPKPQTQNGNLQSEISNIPTTPAVQTSSFGRIIKPVVKLDLESIITQYVHI